MTIFSTAVARQAVAVPAQALAEPEMVDSLPTLPPRSPCQIMEEAHHCSPDEKIQGNRIANLMSFHLTN